MAPISIRDHFRVRLQEGAVVESHLAIVEAAAQAGEHPVDLFGLANSVTVSRFVDQTSASRQFRQRQALLDRASGNAD